MFIGFWMGVLCFATQIIVGGEQDTNSPVDLNFKKTPQPVFIKEITLSPEDRISLDGDDGKLTSVRRKE